MLVTVKIGRNTFSANVDSPDDWVIVEVDGEPIVGIDTNYFDGTYEDACEPEGSPPHLVIGCWSEPENEGWKRLAVKPMDGLIARPFRDAL